MTTFNAGDTAWASLAWASMAFDIGDGAYGRALAAEELPESLKWVRWVPNGFLFGWDDLSMRERAMIVSVGHHNKWDEDVPRRLMIEVEGGYVTVHASDGPIALTILDAESMTFAEASGTGSDLSFAAKKQELEETVAAELESYSNPNGILIGDLEAGQRVSIGESTGDSEHTEPFYGVVVEVRTRTVIVRHEDEDEDGDRYCVYIHDVVSIEKE